MSADSAPIIFPEPGRGTYLLILRLTAAACLAIGRRGTFDFPTGWYAYVGSALQAGGLRGRLKHHLTPVRCPHWHIDALRQRAAVIQVWYVVSNERLEHHWAALLAARPEVNMPATRFGASDCTCPAHLFHFTSAPTPDQFRALASDRSIIQCWINPASDQPEATS
jgi:Uri superfamily endonuclease